MPPRLRSPRFSSIQASSTAPSRSHGSPLTPTLECQCAPSSQNARCFSSTPQVNTRLRRHMWAWLDGPGRVFKDPLPGSTNYLSAYDRRGKLLRAGIPVEKPDSSSPENVDANDPEGAEKIARIKAAQEAVTPSGEQKLPPETTADLRPFPQNTQFISESILSEDLRNEIWRRVKGGKSVRAVSVELGVDMRRVGAVVRLVDMEKQWRREGKQLAKPYAKAIHEMVRTTPYTPPPLPPTHHESINDLPVHALTRPQIFHPAAESSPFNRVDAGRVFSAAPRALPDAEPRKRELAGKSGNETEILLPAEDRIPHPYMVEFEKDKLNTQLRAREVEERYMKRLEAEELERAARSKAKKEREEKMVKKVDDGRGRWEFRVREVVASRDRTGSNGRGTGAPGMRYGAPNEERKRGKVKIPTRVEV